MVDVNERVYRDLELMGHEVALVVPDRWRHRGATGDIHPTDWPGSAGSFAPDVAYVDEEPYPVTHPRFLGRLPRNPGGSFCGSTR